jgi:Flp pilus assembly protein TadB
VLTAALLGALAAALMVRQWVPRRLVGVTGSVPSRSFDSGKGSRWWASPAVAAVLAAVAVLQLVDPPLGLLLGAGAGVAAHRWVSRAESSADRRRYEQLTRDLPHAVDLLVACLAVGRPPAAALSVVASALRGPLAQELRAVASQLDMGADAPAVWQRLSRNPALAPVGRAFARATRSGSSVTAALSGCADDLRRRGRADAQARARSTGVKAAGPLGACFLPAFVLIGIVPTVASLFADVLP